MASLDAVARRGLLVLFIWAPVLLGGTQSVRAQVLRGTVREEITLRPISSAEVLLIDSAGRVVATGASDASGGFAVAAPAPGWLWLRVLAPGFDSLDTPPTRLTASQDIALDVQLIPSAIELPGIEVTVDPLQQMRLELANRGVRVEELGNRFIGAEVLEKRFSSRDVGEVLSARGLPGVSIIRPERASESGSDQYLCVTLLRGRTGQGLSRCAIVVLDGRVIPLDIAAQVAVEQIQAVVVLLPTEATLVYGTMGGGGALLLFTKSVGKGR